MSKSATDLPGTVLRLLSEDGRHPKLDKNLKVGVLGVVLHLAPADRSGYEVCPGRSAGCTAACLNTAGFQYARKENARINRTRLFFEDRPRFMDMLIRVIVGLRSKGYNGRTDQSGFVVDYPKPLRQRLANAVRAAKADYQINRKRRLETV